MALRRAPDLCPTDTPRVSRETLPLLSADRVAAMTRVAQAFSDPIRVQILSLLARVPDLCTCELESLLTLRQSKVSYHMKQLLEAGLVTREIAGAWSHYRLHDLHQWERFTHCFGE